MVALAQFSLTHFRSHAQRSVSLGEHTVFIGPNGAGKTNLLEAISVLATTRSFRSQRDSEVVQWGADVARVTNAEREVAIMVAPTYQKLVKYRGVACRPLEYLGSLRMVLFTPDSLRIITGAPADRRRFLDMFLSQSDRVYAQALTDYRRILAQRNSLLKKWQVFAGARDNLAAWDEQLATAGAVIVARRKAFVAALGEPLAAAYRQLSGPAAPQVTITYQTTGADEPAAFLEQLAAIQARELVVRSTLVGPQRDDLQFTFDDYSFSDYASRGQIRTLLVALKAVEAQLLAATDTSPILLFDDLFSELDADHRAAIGEVFAPYQTVTTTTELAYVPDALRAAGHIETVGQ